MATIPGCENGRELFLVGAVARSRTHMSIDDSKLTHPITIAKPRMIAPSQSVAELLRSPGTNVSHLHFSMFLPFLQARNMWRRASRVRTSCCE